MGTIRDWVDGHRVATAVIAGVIVVALIATVMVLRRQMAVTGTTGSGAPTSVAEFSESDNDDPSASTEAVDAADTRVRQATISGWAGFDRGQQERAEKIAQVVAGYDSSESRQAREDRLSTYVTDPSVLPDKPVLRSGRLSEEGTSETATAIVNQSGTTFLGVDDLNGDGTPWARVQVDLTWTATVSVVGNTNLAYSGRDRWTVWVPYYPADGDRAAKFEEPDSDEVWG